MLENVASFEREKDATQRSSMSEATRALHGQQQATAQRVAAAHEALSVDLEQRTPRQ